MHTEPDYEILNTPGRPVKAWIRGVPMEAAARATTTKDADLIDEIPMAYKDIDAVMAAQQDLVEIVHTLKQVVCVKG